MSDEEADRLVKTFKQQMMTFIGGSQCLTLQPSPSYIVPLISLLCLITSLRRQWVKLPVLQMIFVAKLSIYCKREGIDLPADMPATISAFCEYWGI